MSFILLIISHSSIAASASGTFAYMSEFFPLKLRPQWIMFGSSLGSFGTILMPVVGLFITRHTWEIPLTDSYTLYGWRIQLLSHLIPGIVALILLRHLPESPKYLMTANEEEKCLIVLHEMFKRNSGKGVDECPIRQLLSSQGTDLEREGDNGSKESSKSL